MKTLIKTALILVLSVIASHNAMATESLDALLNKIDADVVAKRLSAPAGNNAIEKIWQFKAIAPFDQRINSRAYDVGAFYVRLAKKAILGKKYVNAQIHLDKVWMLASLTPGLEPTQDALDKVYKSNGKTKVTKQAYVAKAAPTAQKQKVVKSDNSAAQKAKKQKQLAAAKLAKAKADKQATKNRIEAEARQRRLAKLRKEEENKARAAQKLATLAAKRERASQPIAVTSKSIADFDLEQDLIDDRETDAIRSALVPICKEILDNEASVVLNTRSKQDYRWLTVRLTLCVRRLDKGFRLRHSHQLEANDKPSISLHPGRSTSLLQKSRG
jgi:colicin import membrane protein